jgi:hypothetical protein
MIRKEQVIGQISPVRKRRQITLSLYKIVACEEFQKQVHEK